MSGKATISERLYADPLQLPDGEFGACISAIVGGSASGALILGTPFLRAYYSVFTIDPLSARAQVGLAPITSAAVALLSKLFSEPAV